jgi:hypothetical protein
VDEEVEADVVAEAAEVDTKTATGLFALYTLI